MSFSETVLLGALAGFTIFLGLPVGRLQLLSARARVGLAMFAVGILAFIFVDVLEHAFEIIDGALDGFKDDKESFGHLAGLTVLLVGGFGIGCAGLGILERACAAPGHRRWRAAQARRSLPMSPLWSWPRRTTPGVVRSRPAS